MSKEHVEMPEAQESIHIDRSPQDVFDFVANQENNPRWRKNVIETVWLDDGPTRPGRRGRQTARIAGRRMSVVAEVVDWDPPRLASFRTVSGAATVRSWYRFEPDGAGCRLTGGAEGELHGIWRYLTAPFLKRVMVRSARSDLRQLKARLEADAPAG